MHVSDALVSPVVAASAGVIAAGLIGVACNKVKKLQREDLVPLMGVMGAFVFAAQMINFTIPGTGSSGHLIGGVLLAAILGPWAAFITLSSILIVQCLVFADGGLFALGCNILNMGATTCLLAFPLVYKPIAGKNLNPVRLSIASVLACVFALETGALMVSVETEASGITALPFATFIEFMLPIHLAIGVVEGIVTAALIVFIAKYRGNLLYEREMVEKDTKTSLKPIYWIFGIFTLIMAGGFTVLASEYPDGLEWSMEKVAQGAEFVSTAPPTSIMPEYNSNFAGIIGALIVMLILWGASSLLFNNLKKRAISESSEGDNGNK